jgi:membrane protease YdiL (CAAX protease family)
LVVLAVGLTLAYELTGSLLTSITMHSLFNLVMIVQLFYQRAHA